MIWTTSQIETVIRLRAEGKLASEIAAAMNLSVSQVHNKLHRLGLTNDGQRYALKAKSERAGDTARQRPVTEHLEHQSGYSLGYILGVLLGDGSTWNSKRGGKVMRLRVRDVEFAEKFQKSLKAVCPATTWISARNRAFNQKASVIRTPENTYPMKARRVTFSEVTCCDPGVAAYFDQLKAAFLSGARYDALTEQGVLEGLFDSEGYFIKTVGYAGLKMTAHFVVRWVSERLIERGIENKVYLSKTGYLSRVSVHRKAAVRKFCSVVTFSIPRKEAIRLRLLVGAA